MTESNTLATVEVEALDHRVLGLSRLIDEYRGAPNIEAWIGSYLDEITDLDVAAVFIRDGRGPLTASLSLLDQIGEIIGEQRAGRSDADYLRAIKIRIAINNSTGRREDLIAILTLIFDGAYPEARFYNHAPASILVDIHGGSPALPPSWTWPDVDRAIRSAKAAGVSLSFIFTDVAASAALVGGSVHAGDPTASAAGGGTVTDPAIGGIGGSVRGSGSVAA